jgi:hypothetical protein
MTDPVDTRSYLERLETYFLGLTRKGLALRSGDVDVLRDWQARGVPEDVVRRGVTEGIRRFLATAEPASPLPAVLRYYRTFVEAEVAAWRRAIEQGRVVVVQASPPVAGARVVADLGAVALQVAEAGLAAATGEAARDAWRKALERLRTRPAHRSLLDELEAIDDDLAAGLLAAAGDAARERVEARVRAAVDDARKRGAGYEARADLEKAERRAATADEAGFESLWEAVLDRARGGDR